MIKSRLTEKLGIKYPIIQAGMGPFSKNNLCVAAANAGVLGLLSTSGLFDKQQQPWIYDAFIKTADSTMDDDMVNVMEKLLKRTYRLTKDKGGIFGINVMVSAELMTQATIIVDTAIRIHEANPDMKKNFKVIFTSSSDPVRWKGKIEGGRFYLDACCSFRQRRTALQESRRGCYHGIRARRMVPYIPGTGPLDDSSARRCRSRFG